MPKSHDGQVSEEGEAQLPLTCVEQETQTTGVEKQTVGTQTDEEPQTREKGTSLPPFAREREARYEHLVDDSPTPACVTIWPPVKGEDGQPKKDGADHYHREFKDLKFQWVNEAFARLLGFENPEDLIGRSCNEFIIQDSEVDQHQLNITEATLFFAKRDMKRCEDEKPRVADYFRRFATLVSKESMDAQEGEVLLRVPSQTENMDKLVQEKMEEAAGDETRPIIDLVNRWRKQDETIAYVSWTTVAKENELGEQTFFSHAKDVTDLVEQTTDVFRRAMEITGNAVAATAVKILVETSLPRPVISLMEEENNPNAFQTYQASVLFADIAGFTQTTRGQEARDTGQDLSAFHTAVKELIDEEFFEQLHLVKTMGDGLMVIGGAPYICADHATIMLDFAKRLQQIAHTCHVNGKPIILRIGMHAGNIIGGLPIASIARWDAFGEGINRASRAESNGRPDEICLTYEAWKSLETLEVEEEQSVVKTDLLQINTRQLKDLHSLVPVDFLLSDKIPERLKEKRLPEMLSLQAEALLQYTSPEFEFIKQLFSLRSVVKCAEEITQLSPKVYDVKGLYPCTMKGLGDTVLLIAGEQLTAPVLQPPKSLTAMDVAQRLLFPGGSRSPSSRRFSVASMVVGRGDSESASASPTPGAAENPH